MRGAPSPRNSASALVVCSAAFTATAAEAANQTGTASAVDATGTAAFLTNAPLIRSIIINEVAWGGTANSSNDEWIELYNPSATNTVDLSGWSLRAADGYPEISIPTGGGYTIGPRGYFLLERGSDDVVMDVKAGWVYPSTVAGVANIMSNGTDEILRLRDPEKRIIDTANSNGYTWPAGTGASTYYSMERRGTMKDTNVAWMTNNKASTWTKHNAKCTSSPPSSCPTSTLIHGTPGYANWARTAIPTPSRTPSLTPTKYRTRTPTLPPPPPLLGINEFVPRPGHDWNHDGVVNTGDEYIELINFGVVDVTLNNYSLDDEVNVGSEPYRLPAGTLKPGERIVLYGSETNLQLSDGGDAVRLLKSNGQLADAYNYSVVRFPDESFCRLPDNGGLDDWNQFCFPTPGLPNSAGQSSVSPPTTGDNESLCPIADTLPQDFAFAECQPFGNNIWNSEYWDRDGWFDGQYLPGSPGKWPLFGD